ncbi:MAG: hypothetical protein WCD70_07920, partial [Alphaproteobacteria bacterium]
MHKFRTNLSPLRGAVYIALCVSVVGASTDIAMAQSTSLSRQAMQENHTTEGQTSDLPPQVNESSQLGTINADVGVDDNMLINAKSDSNNWLLYGRTYKNQRFSPLKQINTETVQKLLPVAIIQTGIADTFEDSPTEVNGVLYIITANDHVQAYNAITGKMLWSYNPVLRYSS